jgi:hypothetical protein
VGHASVFEHMSKCLTHWGSDISGGPGHWLSGSGPLYD